MYTEVTFTDSLFSSSLVTVPHYQDCRLFITEQKNKSELKMEVESWGAVPQPVTEVSPFFLRLNKRPN
jgi:hypothetical protein